MSDSHAPTSEAVASGIGLSSASSSSVPLDLLDPALLEEDVAASQVANPNNVNAEQDAQTLSAVRVFGRGQQMEEQYQHEEKVQSRDEEAEKLTIEFASAFETGPQREEAILRAEKPIEQSDDASHEKANIDINGLNDNAVSDPAELEKASMELEDQGQNTESQEARFDNDPPPSALVDDGRKIKEENIDDALHAVQTHALITEQISEDMDKEVNLANDQDPASDTIPTSLVVAGTGSAIASASDSGPPVLSHTIDNDITKPASSRSVSGSVRPQRERKVVSSPKNQDKEHTPVTGNGNGNNGTAGTRRVSARNGVEKPISTSSAGANSSTGTSRTRGAIAAAAAATQRDSAGANVTALINNTGSSSGSASSNSNRAPRKPNSSSSSEKGSSIGASAAPSQESIRPKLHKQSSSMSLRNRVRGEANKEGTAGVDDNHVPSIRRRRNRQSREEKEGGDGVSQDQDEGVTRCICGKNDDDAPGFMIQCETCKVWQHGPCVGYKEERLCPDTYYCEVCRPDLQSTIVRGKKHARSASSASSRTASGKEKSLEHVNINDEQDILEKERTHDPSQTSSQITLHGQSPAQAKVHALEQIQEQTTAKSNSSSALQGLDRESFSPQPPQSPSHVPHHRSRASADAAIISAFLDSNQKKESPSPSSPGTALSVGSNSGGGDSTSSFPLAADGKRPMYPPGTSHLSAPLAPKRRSTMNSRDSAAFDESIMLANVNAFKESRLMALAGEKGKRKKNTDGEREDSEEMLTTEGREAMYAVKEEEEDASGTDNDDGEIEEDENDLLAKDADAKMANLANGKRLHSEKHAETVLEKRRSPENASFGHTSDTVGVQARATMEAEDEVDVPQGQQRSLSPGQMQHREVKRRRRRGNGFGAPTSRGRKVPGDRGRQVALSKTERDNPAVEGRDRLGAAVGDTNDEMRRNEVPLGPMSGKKRKRNLGEGDEEPVPARAASPTASTATTETSSSSDKPLANKRHKASQSAGTVLDVPALVALATSLHPDTESSDATQHAQSQYADSVTSTIAFKKSPGESSNTAEANNAASPNGSHSATTTLASKGKQREFDMSAYPPDLATPAAFRGKRGSNLKNQNNIEETEEGNEDDINASNIDALNKLKHPNQYTYRGRGGGGPGSRGGLKHSPNKRAPLTTAHAAAEAVRRGFRDDTPNVEDLTHQPVSWGLPDHLSHLAHLLPSAVPPPLQVPVYSRSPVPSALASPPEPVSFALNGQTPASASSSQSSSTLAPSAVMSTVSQVEPSTKVRFPPRRMSMVEMRKRTKSVLDYLGRVQVEMVDQNSRNNALVLLQSCLNNTGSSPAAPGSPVSLGRIQDTPIPQSAAMIDDLSRQLIGFQERYM